MAKFKNYFKKCYEKKKSLEMCTLVGGSDDHSALVAVNVLTYRHS
jgi:hypothetical protein